MTHPILRRFAISLYGAPPDYPLEAFCALLASHGIGGIGLTPPVFSAHAPEEIAAVLARHGLRAASLNSAGYFLHADPAEAAAQAALDARLLAAALVLQAPVNVIPGGLLHTLPGAAGADPALLRAATRRALAAMAAATPKDVALSLEPMHPMAMGLRSCLNQLSAARDAIQDLPGFGLTLDLFHSYWDDGIEALLRDTAGLLRVVQVCGVVLPRDGGPPRRAALRQGEIDVAAFLRALDAAGYDGMIEYEVFFDAMGRPTPEALVEQAVRDFAAISG
ncbi:sugar phosphate isomerase/epimerase family protein [Humitalea sp. 24SJ18S-53]|uniref:sugar phosphate isomerase/epimerase family protein n=1 Tax=Humitalea sp. 24SJ18S-53 TaxID=3422307 RepID=UPI003D67CC37